MADTLEVDNGRAHVFKNKKVYIRRHVKVVNQLKIHIKTCFYFMDEYTRKCINFTHLNKGNNKITELRIILQRESQNS